MFPTSAFLHLVTATFPALQVIQGGATPETEEDEDLVRAVLQGDRLAGSELIRRHMRAVLRRTTRLLGRTADAEDAAQDALYEALRDLKKLEDPKRFGAWVGMIAVHQVHRRFRRQKLRRALGLDKSTNEGHLHSLVSSTADPSVTAQLAQVDSVLRKAKVDDQLAWMLRHVEGLTLNEIAEQQSTSLATVKRRISRVQDMIEARFGTEISQGQEQ